MDGFPQTTKFTSISELKYRAKNHMIGQYGIAINAVITIQLITMGLSIMVDSVFPNTSLTENIMYYIVQFLLMLFMGFFSAGQCLLYLNICSGRPASSIMIFSGFKNQPDTILLVQFFQMALYALCLAPGTIALLVGNAQKNTSMLLVSWLMLAIAFVAVIYFGICFSQAFYLLYDFPNLKPVELLKMSNELMTGYKWKYFLLLCSFIPLLLVGLLSFGIGLLWVEPYMNAAFTNFFFELMQNRETKRSMQ